MYVRFIHGFFGENNTQLRVILTKKNWWLKHNWFFAIQIHRHNYAFHQMIKQSVFFQGTANKSQRCAMCRGPIPSEFLDHPQLVYGVQESRNSEDGYQWFYEGRNGKFSKHVLSFSLSLFCHLLQNHAWNVGCSIWTEKKTHTQLVNSRNRFGTAILTIKYLN